ncbi:sensor histidine kinase [Pseudonocardia sp. CA-107938]|uniref:sensor histidine kinase n=1 Tax=Pseudonocardia sp. CA-107938 TaxID=3240021 RepID=UPI003D8D798E
MTALVGILLAVCGLVIGFLIGRRTARRGAAAPARTAAPAPRPTIADLLQRVFHATDQGLAVLSKHSDVVLHNARAVELGLVGDGRIDSRAAAAAERVERDGNPLAVDLSPLDRRGRRPSAVFAQVRPLGDGFAVVEAADTSEAVRLENTRRDFVANVSHELKTPVGAMGLLAEAVLDAADDPDEVRRFGTKILNESTRMGNLVTELIALSRLTGAERLPEMQTVEIDEVVNESLARAKLSAEAAGIAFTVDEPSGLEVQGDLQLLVTALSNLLENAVAYSRSDASVSVSRRLVDDWVEIAVTDRGIGIAPEHQQRVFERFFRVDPARSRATGGTGLGLAIVKHVLANHGGEVRLWSRPGTGSTFTMRLPAAAALTVDQAEPAAIGGTT